MSNIELPKNLKPYAEVFGKGDVWLRYFPERFYPRDKYTKIEMLLTHLRHIRDNIRAKNLPVWAKASEVLQTDANNVIRPILRSQGRWGYKHFFTVIDHFEDSYSDYRSYLAELKKLNYWNSTPSKASEEIWPIVEQTVKQEVENQNLEKDFFICGVGSISYGVFSKKSADIDLIYVGKKISEPIDQDTYDINEKVITFCNNVEKELIEKRPEGYKYNDLDVTLFDTQWYKHLTDQKMITDWPIHIKQEGYGFVPLNTISSKVNRFIVGDTKFMKLLDKAGENTAKKNRFFRAFLIDDIIHVMSRIKGHKGGKVKKGVPLSPLKERQKSD